MNNMITKEYISNKEAREIIGVSDKTMTRHFEKIRKLNPKSVIIRGAVNRRDFEHYFNIGSSYRRENKKSN